ncbi:MAG: glutaredoxin family protein [Halobacteriaceae archaeon]
MDFDSSVPDLSDTEDQDPQSIRENIDDAIANSDVVIFMKGNARAPQCGYSARAIELIAKHRSLEDVRVENVLPALDEYRVALSTHSDWETIPQVYVNGEFIGGSDILARMDEEGDLAEALNAI